MDCKKGPKRNANHAPIAVDARESLVPAGRRLQYKVLANGLLASNGLLSANAVQSACSFRRTSAQCKRSLPKSYLRHREHE